MMKKIQMTALAFKTAKEAFRKIYKKHKTQVARAKKGAKRGLRGTGIEPYDLKKSFLKKQLRGLKITGQAEFKAQPGLKNRIKLRIEQAKKNREKFKKPVIFGKAYQSDKAGKTMQVQPLSRQQRKLMLKEMAVSADKGYKKARLRKFGYEKGGDIKTLKNVAGKLQKASKAHAGQSKKLKKIISKYV
jgi:hypothetical protein|tara:strand:- start:1094 stop:1657 length:564 start_codon:yes stop_codon:yes gene_type:complete